MCPPHSFTFIYAEDYAASYSCDCHRLFRLCSFPTSKTLEGNSISLQKYLFNFFLSPYQGKVWRSGRVLGRNARDRWIESAVWCLVFFHWKFHRIYPSQMLVNSILWKGNLIGKLRKVGNFHLWKGNIIGKLRKVGNLHLLKREYNRKTSKRSEIYIRNVGKNRICPS